MSRVQFKRGIVAIQNLYVEVCTSLTLGGMLMAVYTNGRL